MTLGPRQTTQTLVGQLLEVALGLGQLWIKLCLGQPNWPPLSDLYSSLAQLGSAAS